MTPQQYEKLVAKIKANQIPDDLLDEAINMVEEYKAQPKPRDAMTQAAYGMGAQITPEQGNEDRARGQVVPKPVAAPVGGTGYLGMDPFARGIAKVKQAISPVASAVLGADKSATGGLGARALEGAGNLLHPLDYWSSLEANAKRQSEQTPDEQMNEAFGFAPAPLLGPGGDVRAEAERIQEESPTANLVGQVGGAFIPGGIGGKAASVVPELGAGLKGAARYGAKAAQGALGSVAGATALQGINDNVSDPGFAGRLGTTATIAAPLGALGGVVGEKFRRMGETLRQENPDLVRGEKAGVLKTSVLSGVTPTDEGQAVIDVANEGDLTRPLLERIQRAEEARVGPIKESYYSTPEGMKAEPVDKLLNVLKDTRGKLNGPDGEVIPGRESAAKKLDNYIAKLTDWSSYDVPEAAAVAEEPAEAATLYKARPPNVADSNEAQTLYKAKPPPEPEANTFYRARPPTRPVEDADTLYKAKPPAKKYPDVKRFTFDPTGQSFDVPVEQPIFEGIPDDRKVVDLTLQRLGLKPEAIASMTDDDARALIDRVFARKPPPTTSNLPPVPGGEEATAAQGKAGTPRARAESESTSLDVEGLSRQKPPAEPEDATFYRARSPEPKPEAPTLYRAKGPAAQETLSEGPETVVKPPAVEPEAPAPESGPRARPRGQPYNARELDQLIEGLNEMHQEGLVTKQPLPNFRRIEEAARTVRDKFVGAGPNMPNEPGGYSAFKTKEAERIAGMEALLKLQKEAEFRLRGFPLPIFPLPTTAGARLRLDPALQYLAPKLGAAGVPAGSIDNFDIIFGRR